MNSRVLRSVAMLGLLGVLSIGAQGCSVSRALNGPSPVAVERVKLGENRSTIISVLGLPKTTETKQNCTVEMTDCRTDMHEFTDGYSAGSKARVVLYLAGDFFTLGLSELLFWPIEMAAGDGTKGRAIVSYGKGDIVKNVILTKADGSPWTGFSPEKN